MGDLPNEWLPLVTEEKLPQRAFYFYDFTNIYLDIIITIHNAGNSRDDMANL